MLVRDRGVPLRRVAAMAIVRASQTMWLWLGFVALVGVLLRLHRGSAAVLRSRAVWMLTWFVAGLAFAGFVYLLYDHAWLGATLDEPSDRPGADAATMFISVYLLESALSFDVVYVIWLQCQLHRVAREHQPRVLFWGLVGAILVRVLVLTGATCLERSGAWPCYVFGVFALYCGVVASRRDDDEDAQPASSRTVAGQRARMRIATLLWRIGRLTDRDESGRFTVIRRGRRVLTMAAACVLTVVTAEILFALDFVAVVSVTTTSFIVVTSSVLAVVAVHSGFVAFGSFDGLRAPRIATALLLGVAGAKLLVRDLLNVPHAVMLAVIAVIVCVGVVPCIAVTRRPVR